MSDKQPTTRNDATVLERLRRRHLEIACDIALGDDLEIHRQIQAANTYARLIEMLEQGGDA